MKYDPHAALNEAAMKTKEAASASDISEDKGREEFFRQQKEAGAWPQAKDKAELAVDSGNDGQPPPEFETHDAGDIDAEPIQPREWLYGNRYCIGFVSANLGDGGVGKTALALADAVSITTGKSLTGEHVFRRENVLIVCLEDDLMEIKRRIKAVMLYHRIDPAEVLGRLFYCVHKSERLVVRGRLGFSTAPGRLGGMMRAAVRKTGSKALIIDPLVKAHAVDENNNVDMDAVVDHLVTIASEERVAIMVSHHTRKGSTEAGNADMGRGATAVKDAARLVYTSVKMNQNERTSFAIEEIEAASLFRVDGGKVNICRPQLAKWFKLVGVKIGNATELYPHGDEIQTVECWTPPDLFAGLTTEVLNLILNKIDSGLPDGGRYSHFGRATTRAAWQVVANFAPGKNEKQAREIIKTWVKNDVLISRDYDDPARRETAKGLFVNPAKRPGNERRY